jgi:hypothetical protein
MASHTTAIRIPSTDVTADWLAAEMAGRAITLAVHLSTQARLPEAVLRPLLEAKQALVLAQHTEEARQ